MKKKQKKVSDFDKSMEDKNAQVNEIIKENMKPNSQKDRIIPDEDGGL